jgi:hypothetical protein
LPPYNMPQHDVRALRSMAWPYSSPSSPAPYGAPLARLQGLTAPPGHAPELLSRTPRCQVLKCETVLAPACNHKLNTVH